MLKTCKKLLTTGFFCASICKCSLTKKLIKKPARSGRMSLVGVRNPTDTRVEAAARQPAGEPAGKSRRHKQNQQEKSPHTLRGGLRATETIQTKTIQAIGGKSTMTITTVDLPVIGKIISDDQDNHVVWYPGAEKILLGKNPTPQKNSYRRSSKDKKIARLEKDLAEAVRALNKVLSTCRGDLDYPEKVGTCIGVVDFSLQIIGDIEKG